MKKTLIALAGAAIVLAGALACNPAGASKAEAYGAMIQHYEQIRLALLNDRLDGVADAASALAEEAEGLLPEVVSAAHAVGAAEDLKTARAAFAELTEPLVRYRELAGGTDVKVAYCPMAGKEWLQKDETIGNPYYGQSMAQCGTFQEN